MRRVILSILVVAVCAAVVPAQTDVTSPGDYVEGFPNDGDWPGSEGPALAINNDSGTKYLHFKGSDQPTGFRVTPSTPQTIVGGMTFTTANDAIERDPMTFELYGSNHGIDGPYTLIASGSTFLPDVRFANNTSPIEFTPGGAFDHYQVLFPTVRDAAAANSMQIGEVELLESSLRIYGPDPRDGFENVLRTTLISWEIDSSIVDPVVQVYFGTDPNATTNNSVSDVTVTELDPATILGEPLDYETTYYWTVHLTSPDPNAGPTWSFTTVPAVPVVTQEPDDIWGAEGGSVAFQVAAEVIGDPEQTLTLDYQWYHEPNDPPTVALIDGADISGATSDTLIITNLEEADAGNYFCVVTGDAGETQSRLARLQLIELLGHWPLDGDATDISGYNNTGIAQGTAPVFEEGIIGQAANFDNVGLFEIPNPAHFDQANSSITVYCWIKSGGTGDWEPCVAKYGENGQGWQLRKHSVQDIHTFTTRGTSGIDDPLSGDPRNIFDNEWHQLVGTYDGMTRKIYLDGEEILSLNETGDIAFTSAPVSIGGRITDAAVYEAFFNGMVDDVRIYKGPMSATMVAQLYSEASGIEICASPLGGDLSGPLGVPDCIVDMYDLASFSLNWLRCVRIVVTRCP